ncbi:MAG: NADH-quinone oxidoreductase subunit C [Syntrophobacteraceae bacterium]
MENSIDEATFESLPDAVIKRWPGKVQSDLDVRRSICLLTCDSSLLPDICEWVFSTLGYRFATLVVVEEAAGWLLRYVFYGQSGSGQIHILLRTAKEEVAVPSISGIVHAADWHERETEDLFGLVFTGHPRLGDFVLHEEWPKDVNPMRLGFDAHLPFQRRELDPEWRPHSIVHAPGAFMMPIGPVYSDVAESAHFLLETVGEDVIRTIRRFFYKYRGVEKISEGCPVDNVILLSERFSGTSAFAHSLAFCLAVEDIAGVDPPPRAKVLRIVLAELERLRHHIAAIAGICGSTALAVATSQAGILEEEALRITGSFTRHRYLFGLNRPGGLTRDFNNSACRGLADDAGKLIDRLCQLNGMLRFTSSFLDRIEEVGIVSREQAITYGLVGPIARASGLVRDLRKTLPYCSYEEVAFDVPVETEGDGYARLRILFREAEQSAAIIRKMAAALPDGEIARPFEYTAGAALGWVEAPRGAAFHWVRITESGAVGRYRLTTPSFTNWHGFHLAAENFAFQDFPIIMATFGLSNAESDR